MKICWDNLENLRLIGKYFKSTISTTKYKIVDECKICGDEFLSSNGKAVTCSRECSAKHNSIIKTGKNHTKEAKKRMSESAKGKPSPFKGKKHTEESKKLISEKNKGKFAGEKNPRYGDHRTWDELHGKEKSNRMKKEKKERWTGENNPNYKENHWCVSKEKWKNKFITKFKDFVESQGYELLDTEWKGSEHYYNVKCDKGHEYKTKTSYFYWNRRCPHCNGTIKKTYQEVCNIFSSEGYELLTPEEEYENTMIKVKVKCDKGHVYKIKPNAFINGRRCRVCNERTISSKGEKEVQNYVKLLVNGVICNDRTQMLNEMTGKNLELDIWIPSLNKAIEYNGKFWHTKSQYVKEKDQMKVEQCKEKGIKLLVICDDEYWKNKEKILLQVKNFILDE